MSKRHAKVVIFKSASNGLLDVPQWYWHIVAGNGAIVATGGEGFSTMAKAKRSLIKARLLLDAPGTKLIGRVADPGTGVEVDTEMLW
jgi:uncharacterized protein YegP (UPF0339 family)